jgi:hypothetical protein
MDGAGVGCVFGCWKISLMLGVSKDVLELAEVFWLMFVIFLEEGLGTFLAGGQHPIGDGDGVSR